MKRLSLPVVAVLTLGVVIDYGIHSRAAAASSGLAATLQGSLADLAFLRRFVDASARATEGNTALTPAGAVDVRLNAIGPLRRPNVRTTITPRIATCANPQATGVFCR